MTIRPVGVNLSHSSSIADDSAGNRRSRPTAVIAEWERKMPLKQTLIRKYSGCTSIFTASFSRSSVTALSKAYKRSGYTEAIC